MTHQEYKDDYRNDNVDELFYTARAVERDIRIRCFGLQLRCTKEPLQWWVLTSEKLLKPMVELPDDAFYTSVEGSPFATGAKGNRIFLAADGVHFTVHQWLGVVMEASHAAVIAV